jgi:hypothetical protein
MLATHDLDDQPDAGVMEKLFGVGGEEAFRRHEGAGFVEVSNENAVEQQGTPCVLSQARPLLQEVAGNAAAYPSQTKETQPDAGVVACPTHG